MNNRYKSVLSIAGSDSIGGAGIQADIKTCMAHGIYAMTVVTAVTAQNSCGVRGIMPVNPSMLRLQLEAVLDDIYPDAVKIGMIPDAVSIGIIAEAIKIYELKNVVVDPVMVATSGDRLAREDSKDALIELLLPHALVVTPNIPEAEVLTGMKIMDSSSRINAAKSLLDRASCGSVLIKGGHESGDSKVMTDVYADSLNGVRIFSHSKTDTRNTHGTGCSLSSAIASELARGPFDFTELPCKIDKSVKWLSAAIARGASIQFGSHHGHGPVNHLTFATNNYEFASHGEE